MAKLKLRIPTLEGLSPELKGFYKALESGGFILDHEDDPDGYGIDNLAALRGKLDEAQRDAERSKKRLQGFAKPDGSLFTVEEIQALTGTSAEQAKLIETLRDKSKTDEQKLAEMVSAAKKPLEAELAKHKQANERYRTSAHNAKKKEVVSKILDKIKPKDEWRGLLESELSRHVEIREAEDGTLSHVIIDPESGKARMSSLTGRDGPMAGDEFASSADIRKKFGACLRGDDKKGADVTNPVTGETNFNSGGRDIVLTREQARDFKTYEAAKAQAKKQGGEVVIDAPAQPGAFAAN